MATVGIMSMQRIFNYGSSLQAYALKRLVEDLNKEGTVRFLDYRPGPTLISEDGSTGGSPSNGLRRAVAKVREYNNVSASLPNKVRFFNHKRTYGSKYYPLVGIEADTNHDFSVDLQIIGSDEVFNCVQSNANVGYAPDLFGRNTKAGSLISYAGSFGNTTLAKIESSGIRDQLANDFAKFDAISVRDSNSRDLIASLTGKAPDVHLDPTLVYDFATEPNRIPKERQFPEKYIISYGYSGRFSDAENRAIRELAQRKNAKVLAFGGLQGSADHFVDCDPFTLLAYFRDADAVVTDTFHGTIFSIINRVPFLTIIRHSKGHGYGNEEKLGYLLQALNLSDRALRSPDSLASKIDDPIDFNAVSAIRERETRSTKQYLSRALDLTP